MCTGRKYRMLFRWFLLSACLVFAISGSAWSETDFEAGNSRGQVVYAPVYSHIYIGDRERPFLLAVTLSIRNTDPRESITINRVNYYDTNGQMLEEHLDQPVVLKSMSAIRFVIQESDKTGGSGASFIVEWESDQAVSSPLIETVMIGAQTQQGISFTSRGVVIKEK